MKALLLLSSGIDSPVAGYLMIRQGYSIFGIHFEHSGDKKNLAKVKKLAKKIGIKKLFLVNNLKNQEMIAEKCNRRYQCLICKRLMYRIGEAIAIREGIDVLITGENLAQVASQTLTNIQLLDKSVKIKVLRPLLGFDKTETMKIARAIGTYDISIEKSAECVFVPKFPVTKGKLAVVEEEESKLDISKIIKINLKDCIEIDF
ncbi:MAG: 7-cyano-7-deazaguanine synthase [Nanoarchaeota archaeon]|nr:7-cyano-7-deazaguanine synthase [Nanoarchaeota archaeon]